MVAHARPLHVVKRADPDPLAISTAAGVLNSASVVSPVNTPLATALAIDSSAATTGTQIAAPNFAPTETTAPVVTQTASVTPTPTETTSTTEPTEAVSATSASKSISLTTVIGSCVGAFIGASALVIFGLWMYRRYSRSLKKQRGPARNITSDKQRRQSRLEPWNKLEDGDDKWEGMYQTKEETRETDHVAPMEKLTMFKKTASIRTAYTHKSADVSTLDFPQSYADFDPKLAETLSSTGTPAIPIPEPRPFMGRVDTNPPDSMASNSFISVHTQMSKMSSGAMSPSLHMAIPTPPPTVSQAHMWESAEVVHYSEAQTAEYVDPSAQDGNQRQSIHNPFFSARDVDPLPRSRSGSVTKSATAKGKERMRYSMDPFDDINEQMPPPKFIQHLATSSTSSTESKEKALQSLIAALNISEDEARSRLRIASMQPSFISNISSIGPDDEDVTKEFPLPPSQSAGRS